MAFYCHYLCSVYFRFSYSVLYFLCVSYILSFWCSLSKTRHLEVLVGWRKNLIRVQKIILNCLGRSQEKNKWHKLYWLFFPYAYEVQAIQAKKKKKRRVNGTLSFFCDRKVLAFLFDVFMSVYIFWGLCMALCGSSESQDCALQSMGVGHVGM